jgi:copper homeostasis protein
VKKTPLLEITVESLGAAEAAERGGADRIELCSELAVGGLTPGHVLLQRVRENIRIPIFAMIRPRAGDFVYSETEFAQMKEEIFAAKSAGASAIVLGLLTKRRGVNVERTAELVKMASPLPVTFHRAFDQCADQSAALEDVVKTGATRVLTSGGKNSAREGVERLAVLIKAAGERLTIVPGSGITAQNVAELAHATGAREFHAGLSSVVREPGANLAAFESAVRQLSNCLKGLAAADPANIPIEN